MDRFLIIGWITKSRLNNWPTPLYIHMFDLITFPNSYETYLATLVARRVRQQNWHLGVQSQVDPTLFPHADSQDNELP
jgi:hypothetical protein